MKNLVLIIVLSVIVGIIGLVIMANHFSNTTEENNKTFPVTYHERIDTNYARLFNDKNSIHEVNAMDVKGRKQVVSFKYGEDYFIELSQLNCSGQGALASLVSITSQQSEQSMNVNYTGAPRELSNTSRYAHRTQESSKHLYVTMYGTMENIKKNDSTLIYQGQLNTFGLKYNRESPQDIFIRDDYEKGDPICIIFLRREGNIYLALIEGKNKAVQHPDNFAEGVFK